MTNHPYDAIVIGAGHNGLVAAGYLAKARRRVLVLERRDRVGGAAATEEPVPGFRFDSHAGYGGFAAEIARHLGLKEHGLEYLPGDFPVFVPAPDGGCLTLYSDVGKSVESIRQFSARDAERYPAFASRVARMAGIVARLQAITPPRLAGPDARDALNLAGLGLSARALGGKDVMELLRVLPMPVADFLDEWFETDALKGALASSGIFGLTLGPYASGTTFLLLHHLALAGGRLWDTRRVRGGIGKLSAALATAAEASGAEIRVGVEVSRVIVRDGRATGVALGSGEEVTAPVVISNADPRRTFGTLVDAYGLDPSFTRAVRNVRFRGACAQVNLALSEPPSFSALPGQGAHLCGAISIGPSVEYLERASDDAKYGRYSERPYLVVRVPSLADSGFAPEGRHAASIFVQYAPYHLRDASWPEAREALGEAVVETLAEYAPNVRGAVIHRQVITPLDLEATYGLTEGNIHHGEMALDQLFVMRPVPGWAHHRTPVQGLYLCGASTHPGGGVSGLPGRNAAREVLRDAR